MLKLNDNKIKFMFVTSKRTKHLHYLPSSITDSNAKFHSNNFNNFGFILDCHLTMNEHVSNIARACCFKICHLAFICKFLTNTAFAALVSVFLMSRIEYHNSLFLGICL